MNRQKILVVDDETSVRGVIVESLMRAGFSVVGCASARDAVNLNPEQFDLMIFDVMMPDMDGFELCRNIRERVDCPILFLTAKTSETDVAYGLAIGGDDYIRKPFTPVELVSRVKAHLRREQRVHHATLTAGDIRFLLTAREITVRGDTIPFTKIEYDICELLAGHRGQVFSKEQIWEHVDGYRRDSDPSTIAEHIKNIRRKLAARDLDPIRTIWGIGYKWE